MNEFISKLGVITIVILAIYIIKKFDDYLFFKREDYHHSDFHEDSNIEADKLNSIHNMINGKGKQNDSMD